MDEQNEGSKQIFDSLYTMNNNTTDVRNASKRMSIGNQSILEEINHLQKITGEMQKCMALITEQTSKIKNSGNELNDITPKLIDSIDEISSQIDQFKV